MIIHLAVLDAYDKVGASAETLYFATKGFTSTPSDTPVNTFFDPRITSPAKISRTMFAPGRTFGASQVGFGDLVLSNEDGALDFLEDYAFDGRSITQYRGDEGSAFPGGYTKVLVATMEQAVPDLRSYRIKIRDRQDEVDIHLQPTKYAGNNALPAGLEGVAGDLKGKPKPICYGVVKNISPPLVNTSKLIYQVNDGAVDSVDEVYDSGIKLSRTWTNWNQETTPVSTALLSCHFADGIYVVTGVGVILTSTDGATWTSRTSSMTNLIHDAAYSPDLDLWVVVGQFSGIETSPDGITWTSRTSPFSFGTGIFTVSWGNGVFVIGASSNQLASSTDGISWTTRTSAQTGGTCRSSVFARGLFVVGGGTNSGEIQTSTDGTTWTLRESGLDNTITTLGIAFGRGLYVAGGLSAASATNVVVATSRDGITWTSREVRDIAFNDVEYSELLGRFIAAGQAAPGYAHVILTSLDGIDWDIQEGGFASSAVQAVGVRDTQVVAVGNGGKIATLKVDADYASEAALLDDDNIPKPGTYLSYLAGGLFRLGSPPAGLITADVTQGAAASDRTAGQIFTDVLVKAGLTSSDWTAADITTLDASLSDVIGYWSGITEVLASDVLSMIAESIIGWWGIDAIGSFRIKELLSPAAGTSVLTITANDMVRHLQRVPPQDPGRGIPSYRSIIRYAKNYTVQDRALAGGVTDVRRAELAREWAEEVSTDATVQTAHLLAREQKYHTLLSVAADAATYASRVQTLRGTKRGMYEFAVPHDSDTETLDLGSIVTIKHPRFGLSAGKKMAMIELDPEPNEGIINLGVWG